MSGGASAFADTTELVDRWRTLSESELHKAGYLIDDATRDIRRAFPDIEDRMALDPDLVLEVRRITCNVVRRRMTNEESENVSQESETTGPYGRSRTFKVAVEWLTPEERRILAGTVNTAPGPPTSAWSNEEPCVPSRW